MPIFSVTEYVDIVHTSSIALLLGFGASFHCIAMCGGIISALSMGLTTPSGTTKTRHFFLVASYNTGRIFSYTVAGMLAGLAGYASIHAGPRQAMFVLLQLFGCGILVILGLHIAGFLPKLKTVDKLGTRAWSYIRPLAHRFFPADTIPRALIAGAIWGWLPCGMVYSVLAWALTTPDPAQAALHMFAFGVGTLPSMLSTGLAGTTILNLTTSRLRHITGMIVIGLGLLYFYLSVIAPPHQAHDHHQHGTVEHHHD